MVSLDWHLRRTGGVTFVELVVASPYDAEVELTSNLTPVWPPRRHGRPVAAWDGARFTATVRAGSRTVVGYATPAEPTDPPASVMTHRPLAEKSAATPTPQQLVQSLGDAAPPRDAVPSENCASSQETLQSQKKLSSQETVGTLYKPEAERKESPMPHSGRSGFEGGETVTTGSPQFKTVENRLQAAERLIHAETVIDAQAAVVATGGIDAVRTLVEQLETDRSKNHPPDIETRLAAVDIPLASLEQLV